MIHFFETMFGSGEAPIAWWQVGTRAVIYFFAVLVYLHVAGIRSIGRQSSLDIIMSIMLGAVLGQGLAGKAVRVGSGDRVKSEAKIIDAGLLQGAVREDQVVPSHRGSA